MARSTRYKGRFAPSPTGPLHLGSLCTALASWLDARAHGGQWLLRIEDIDRERCDVSHAQSIIESLQAHGLEHDGPIGWQSRRGLRYRNALARLHGQQLLYRCNCSRKRIEMQLLEAGWQALPGAERPYPGFCRSLMRSSGAGALRFIVPDQAVRFQDRFAGLQSSCLSRSLGDFVVLRADGLNSYHLAVVVDDEADGVTDVVRGDDLLESTARQIALQDALGYRRLRYGHIPVLKDAEGQKLSKQQGALPLRAEKAPSNLQAAARHIGLGQLHAGSIPAFLEQAIEAWAQRWL
ncbi:MAG: tRNA glutamyl-Q(34) synthetase GluQRS, partial [Betaproteobacteria bacterium]|nr:tRNA glutamyl-Q(34) synthetase GluQRS [Betaproteobacteria bacterium]